MTLGGKNKVEVTIAGTSSKGGEDLQWKKVTHKKEKNTSARGGFGNKDLPNEAKPNWKASVTLNDVTQEHKAPTLDTHNTLAVVPYTGLLHKPLTAVDGKDQEALSATNDTSEQPNEQNMSYITTRKKKSDTIGSKHCLPPWSQRIVVFVGMLVVSPIKVPSFT